MSTHPGAAPPRPPKLPEWQAGEWLNTDRPLDLAALRGRVVLVHAFQMLCPGCLADGLPQAERVHRSFAPDDVAVIGLHTVFEHHDVMTAKALRAFVHEYRWSFPIGIDLPSVDDPVPRTMRAYGLRGTPSHIVLDRQGFVRLHHFGRIDDLVLGALLGRLIAEPAGLGREPADRGSEPAAPGREPSGPGCEPSGCAV